MVLHHEDEEPCYASDCSWSDDSEHSEDEESWYLDDEDDNV
jgi:hypothetical protein